jgi:hypothetical protein
MKPFKVLSIDGGGIKGLYSATILRLFESDLRNARGDDARIIDYVDLVCGTSTGGLIGLALSLRIPATTICDFYERKGPEIFKGSQGFLARFRQTMYGGKFSDERLRAALVQLFGDRTIGDSHCLLCVPTYDFTQGTYGIFKFDHKEGNLSRHNVLSMVDVALATSAAPTFFPLAQIDELNSTQYVDGGVWANNPSLIGLVEAMSYFVGPGKAFDRLNLLSLASLNFSPGKPPLLKRRRSFVRWAPDLFDLSLIAQSEFTDVVLGRMQQVQLLPLTYTRIPSAAIGREQAGYIALDLASVESFALMKQMAENTYYEFRRKAVIQEFFAEPKLYRVKNAAAPA